MNHGNYPCGDIMPEMSGMPEEAVDVVAQKVKPLLGMLYPTVP